MPAALQKEIRSGKRLWPEKEPGGSAILRGPKTWEEAHKVVLEYEHREATLRASANSIFTHDQDPPNSAAAEARKELDKLKAEAKKLAKTSATAAAKAVKHQSMLALQDRERVRARRSVSTSELTVVAPKGKIARTPMTRSFASKPSLTEAAPVGACRATQKGQGQSRPEGRREGHGQQAQGVPLLRQEWVLLPTLGSSCPWMSCHRIGGTLPRTRRVATSIGLW